MKAEYIDHMGDDLRVANAARVSFDKQVSEFRDNDLKLIKYLGSHGHWTPFSHCIVTLRETVPIFVARQRFKHMVGFTYNEVSRRYVDSDPEFFVPDRWRQRADNKKQGSKENEILLSNRIYEQYLEFLVKAEDLYTEMLALNVAPEQARMVLPQSMYTSYYVTGSLYAWARAYNLRSDEHAQKEIQELAAEWDKLIAPIFPASWKALTYG